MPTYLRGNPLRDAGRLTVGCRSSRWHAPGPSSRNAGDGWAPTGTPACRQRGWRSRTRAGTRGVARATAEPTRGLRDTALRIEGGSRLLRARGDRSGPTRRRSRKAVLDDRGGCAARRATGAVLRSPALVPEDLYAGVEPVPRGGSGTGCAGPGQRRQHEHLLRPLPRHLLAAVDGGRRGRGDRRVSGTGRVRLMASDTNKVWRIVDAQDVEGADGCRSGWSGGSTGSSTAAACGWSFSTETGPMTVERRALDGAPRRGPPRPTSVVICTYNRVDDCLNTLAALAATPEALASRRRGRRGGPGHRPARVPPAVRRDRERLGDRLRYVRQPNLGGAGGFTRGLFDATAGDRPTTRDVLLMDDDVLLEPEILIRLTAFAACTTHPTIVGGQMLNLLHPAHLHISAESADPELLQVGSPMPGALNEAYLLGLDERQLPIGAGAPGRHRVQRLVVVPDPGGDRPRDRLPAAAVLPVGRHRVRLPRPRARLPDGGAARRRRLARRLRVEGLGRVAPLLQHAQRPDHRGAAHRLLGARGSPGGWAAARRSTSSRCTTGWRRR